MKKISKEEAKEWLENNFSYIVLCHWGGGAGKKSKFFDDRRKVSFYETFKNVKHGLIKNPERLFSPTKQELTQLLSSKTDKNTIKRLQDAVEQRYGIKNISFHKETVEKRNKTLKKVLSSSATIQKRKETNIKKFGAENPQQNKQVKEKTRQTNIKKYGVEHPLQNPKIMEKVQKTKIKNGNLAIVAGSSLRDVAWKKGCSYSQLSALYRKFGSATVIDYNLLQTQIEQQIKYVLDKHNVFYVSNKRLTFAKQRPDFYISANKLVLECDGLYWHSDAKVDKKYHFTKKQVYNGLDCTSLFFREDEILEKLEIVESIITNKLKLSQRIFARKCTVVTIKSNDKFFTENHLMGKGSGRIYALQFHNKIVCAIQVKWKSRSDKILEISRFAPRIGHSVVGGFSKLVSHVIKAERPNRITTFIDLRYGSGNYLHKLGWKHVKTTLSFKWCKNQKTVHRMAFPGNNGYEHGFRKIWDCGQARYELILGK